MVKPDLPPLPFGSSLPPNSAHLQNGKTNPAVSLSAVIQMKKTLKPVFAFAGLVRRNLSTSHMKILLFFERARA